MQDRYQGLPRNIDKRFSQAIEAKKSGYVYVYFSNESSEMVWFDNFMLTHERGRILEETHYYPFGLTMLGISSKAINYGAPGNKQKYNGKLQENMEFTDASGLEWYDYGARVYEPQIGRWSAIDPFAAKWMAVSPFAYTLNNPVNAVDPNGKDVYFVISTDGGSDISDAAATRKREIEQSKGFNEKYDHVYVISVKDLGQLKAKVSAAIQDATKKGYGKTVEASFFSHAAPDGPRGEVKASENSLQSVTHDPLNRGQLSPDGWKGIDFNFDPENSVAAFYGCNTDEFAQKFLEYQPNVKYSAGLDGYSGGSYAYEGRMNSTWFNWTSDEVYMVTKFNPADLGQKGAVTVAPKNVYSRDGSTIDHGQDRAGNSYTVRRAVAQIYGNVTLKCDDKSGKMAPASGSGQ